MRKHLIIAGIIFTAPIPPATAVTKCAAPDRYATRQNIMRNIPVPKAPLPPAVHFLPQYFLTCRIKTGTKYEKIFVLAIAPFGAFATTQ